MSSDCNSQSEAQHDTRIVAGDFFTKTMVLEVLSVLPDGSSRRLCMDIDTDRATGVVVSFNVAFADAHQLDLFEHLPPSFN
jgi:hypothetical protein